MLGRYSRNLVLWLVLVASPAFGEICLDVVKQVGACGLSIRLEAEEPWYIQGESVYFKLVFENRSQKPLLIPSDAESVKGDLSALSLVKYEEAPEGLWMDVVSRSPKPADWEPCRITSVPIVLLPGDKHEVHLPRENALQDGIVMTSRIWWTPERTGEHRVRYTMDYYQLTAVIQVKPIESYEVRWLSYPSGEGKAQRLREILLAKVEGQTLVLLKQSLTYSLKPDDVSSHVITRDYLLSLQGIAPIGFERLFSLQGDLAFADRDQRILPADRKINFSSKGIVVQSVDPSRYPGYVAKDPERGRL